MVEGSRQLSSSTVLQNLKKSLRTISSPYWRAVLRSFDAIACRKARTCIERIEAISSLPKNFRSHESKASFIFCWLSGEYCRSTRQYSRKGSTASKRRICDNSLDVQDSTP